MSSKLAHTLYGEPSTRDAKLADSAAGSRPAPVGSPYVGRNRCIANEDTCEGPRAKGTDYCIGHIRSLKIDVPEIEEVTPE